MRQELAKTGTVYEEQWVHNKTRFIIGYMLGIVLFLFAIPYGLYMLSKLDHLPGHIGFSIPEPLIIAISLLLFVNGVLFMVWSNIALVKIGKGGPAEGLNISIHPKTKKLVIVGPYRYCRNPMIFGAFTLYLSFALFLHSAIVLLILVFLLLFGVMYLKLSEEKRLERDFGNEYDAYKKVVPMIVPLKFFKK